MLDYEHESVFPRFAAPSAASHRGLCQGISQVAEQFAVSVATIKRYLKQRRESGHVEPKTIPGRPAMKGAVLRAHLLAQLEAHPDVTREAHCRLFEATHGIQVSTASITRARQALGWTRKKSQMTRKRAKGSHASCLADDSQPFGK